MHVLRTKRKGARHSSLISIISLEKGMTMELKRTAQETDVFFPELCVVLPGLLFGCPDLTCFENES